jgi:hypothetical protein
LGNLQEPRLSPDDGEAWQAFRQLKEKTMNDDLTNGLGALPPLAPMPSLEPFSYQEQINLKRYENGLATADDQLAQGIIDPETHAGFHQQLHRLIAPLRAKQQSAAQQAQQAQLQAALHGAAVAQALKHANAQHDAQPFPDRVAWLTEPRSGPTAAFDPQGEGKWRQVEWPQQQGAEKLTGDHPGRWANSLVLLWTPKAG